MTPKIGYRMNTEISERKHVSPVYQGAEPPGMVDFNKSKCKEELDMPVNILMMNPGDPGMASTRDLDRRSHVNAQNAMMLQTLRNSGAVSEKKAD